MELGFEVDVNRFPVVTVCERGGLSDTQRSELVDILDDLVSRRGRHGLVLDLRAASAMPQRQRMFVTERWQMMSRLLTEKWAAIGVAVRPPLLRALPIGAFWLKAAPVPSKIFPSLEEASLWVRATVSQDVSLAASGPRDLKVRSTR